MPIVSSVIAKDVPQKNGRRWIREDHTDDQGVVYEVWYSAPDKSFDVQKEMLARVPELDAELAAKEKQATDADAAIAAIVATLTKEQAAALTTDKLADAVAAIKDAP